MSEEIIVVAPSLDEFIRERERQGDHVDGSQCDFRLGRGHPLSRKRCSMCTRLSPLIDLSVSWNQKIDTGRLSGRSIEIVETPGVRSIKDAEATWKLYRECEAVQTCFLRRYYASFTCGSGHYVLRDVTSSHPPDLCPMVAQIADLLSPSEKNPDKAAGLPGHFVHGNPTVSSISFLGRLPVPLKSGPYLIQIDFGGGDSAALTTAAATLLARQKSVGSVVVGDDVIGAIVFDKSRGTLTVRSDANFSSFLREYPRHWRLIALLMLIRGLLSLYRPDEIKEYLPIIGRTSSARNLREAFEDIKGFPIPCDLFSRLSSVVVA